MQKTTFYIRNMDCAAEEQMVRMQLDGFADISALEFDLAGRRLEVFHAGDERAILGALESLDLGASLVGSAAAGEPALRAGSAQSERRLLIWVLAINLFFFGLEMLTGFLANSMGLVADSLDMLADSLVYGLALFAIGGSLARKKNIAKTTGYFQLFLACFGIFEVARRFLGVEETPAFEVMIVISFLALIGNATSLYLLQKNQSQDAHMMASVICTSNDVIANAGVILAGVLVLATQSKIPDLVVGAVVFALVARGAVRILRIAK